MKYNMHRSYLFILASFLLAGTALAQSKEEAKGDLTRLVDPVPDKGLQNSGPGLEQMVEVIHELMRLGEEKKVRYFGESAGPALQRIAKDLDLGMLVGEGNNNPLLYLTTSAPISGLRFFDELERTDRFRYEILVRSFYRPTSLIGSPATRGEYRAEFMGLMDRTVSSPTQSLDIKLRIAVLCLDSNLLTASCKELLLENADLALTKYSRSSRKILDLVVPPGGDLPAELSLPQAMALIEHRPSARVMDTLVDSPHIEARQSVAQWLRSERHADEFPFASQLSILIRLLGDPDVAVSGEARRSLLEFVRDDNWVFSIQEMISVLDGLASQSAPSVQVHELGRAIIRALASITDRSGDEAQELFAAIFRFKGGILRQEVVQRGLGTTSQGSELLMAYAIPLVKVASMADEESKDLVYSRLIAEVQRGHRGDQVWASQFLDLLTSGVIRQEEFWKFLKAMDPSRQQSVQDLLAHLPEERVPEAIQWLAQNRDIVGLMAIISPAHWQEAGPEMRRILGAPLAPNGERLIAGAALLNTGLASAEEAKTFGEMLIGLIQSPEGRADLDWFLNHQSRNTGPLWPVVAAVLLNSAEAPDTVVERLSLRTRYNSMTKDSIARVLRAAELRAAKSDPSLVFGGLGNTGLEAMTQDPSLIQPTLMRAWWENEVGGVHSRARVLVRSNRPELIEFARERMLRSAASASPQQVKSLSTPLLWLPGEGSVQGLLEIAMASGSEELVSFLEGKIAERIRLRELAERWSNPGAGIGGLDTTKKKVLALLESPSEEVRIEAILGLATLNATEELPRLIALVGSGSEGEKVAAKEALRILRERAALDQGAKPGADAKDNNDKADRGDNASSGE